MITFYNFSERIAHDGDLGRCLKPHVDGVDPGSRIIAEFDQVLQVVLESHADALKDDGRAFSLDHDTRLIDSFRD